MVENKFDEVGTKKISKLIIEKWINDPFTLKIDFFLSTDRKYSIHCMSQKGI